MGDRAVVVVTQEEGEVPIYLYTHWGGSTLPEVVQAALRRGRSRWGDPPYLTRIIFSEMIQDEVLEETGFGISVHLIEGRQILVNIPAKQIEIEGKPAMSFEAFVNQTEVGWAERY